MWMLLIYDVCKYHFKSTVLACFSHIHSPFNLNCIIHSRELRLNMNCRSVFLLNSRCSTNLQSSLFILLRNRRNVLLLFVVYHRSQSVGSCVDIACCSHASLLSGVGWARETHIIRCHQAHLMHIAAIEAIRCKAKRIISRLCLRSVVHVRSVILVAWWDGSWSHVALGIVEVAAALKRISHCPCIQILLNKEFIILLRML